MARFGAVLVSRSLRATLAVALVLLALVSAASARAAGIGYLYAGSLTGKAVQVFSVGGTGELTLAGSAATTDTYVVGVALVDTTSGHYVYALSTPKPGATNSLIDEYAVEAASGLLRKLGEPVAAEDACPGTGNNLYSFDSGSPGSAKIFYPTCVREPGLSYDSVNDSTGLLEDPGQRRFPGEDPSMAIAGNELTFAYNDEREAELQAIEIPAAGGEPVLLGLPNALFGCNCTEKKQRAYGPAAAEPGRFAILGLAPFDELEPGTGLGIYGFDSAGGYAHRTTGEPTAAAFAEPNLVVGENGPLLEFTGKDGAATGGSEIELSAAPTEIPPGPEEDPNFIETIYPLGPFLYAGIYLHQAVELKDSAALGIGLLPEPFVAGSAISVTSMAGFLTGTPTGTTTPGGETPAKSTGELPKPAGGKPIVVPLKLAASASAHLKLGVLKLKVTCPTACTVGGKVLSKAARAARASGRLTAAQFKPVHLRGGPDPISVSLRFRPAQERLIRSLLRHHRKVEARVTVTASGETPVARLIRILR